MDVIEYVTTKYGNPAALEMEIPTPMSVEIGHVSLARENEAGGSWGQEVHILHVNI